MVALKGSKPTIRINSYGGVKERLLKGIQRTRPEDWKIKAEQIYAEMGRPTSGAHASMVDDMKKFMLLLMFWELKLTG